MNSFIVSHNGTIFPHYQQAILYAYNTAPLGIISNIMLLKDDALIPVSIAACLRQGHPKAEYRLEYNDEFDWDLIEEEKPNV